MAIRAAVDETWNMRKVSLEELMNYALPVNTRMVTVEKSRDDREGQQMVFTLMPDYTYKIGPVPETEATVKFDTPNQHTLDVLAVMRADRKPYCIKDLVEHDQVGGDHRKRAIEYGLERLEQQALIERCEAPVEKKGRGRRPVYYRAAGTDVPAGFRKGEVRSIHRKTTGEMQNPSAGTDLNFPEEFGKIDHRKNKTGSTGAGACSTETEGSIIPVDDFSENNRKNETPSTGTDLNNPADPWVNKQIDQTSWD